MKTDTLEFFEQKVKSCKSRQNKAIMRRDITAVKNLQKKIVYYQEAIVALTEVDLLRLELSTIKKKKRPE